MGKEADLVRILKNLCETFLMIGIQQDQKARFLINKIDFFKMVESLRFVSNLQQTVGEKIVSQELIILAPHLPKLKKDRLNFLKKIKIRQAWLICH